MALRARAGPGLDALLSRSQRPVFTYLFITVTDHPMKFRTTNGYAK